MAFDLESFHAEAVQTPSHESVEAMRTLLCETLAEAGCEPTVDDLGNVLAARGQPATTATTHLVLNTHLDTVAPHVPYERDGDVVRGRGACDAKGPLAALVVAFLGADPGEGRLTLAITPDEETLMTGAAGLADQLSADGYIVGEPTDLDVCVAARGQCEAQITISGEQGHAASVPGVRNSVAGLEPVLAGLRTFDADSEEDPMLGEPKLTPTMLEAGSAPNRVPERTTLTVDRRSVPPETADSFRSALEAHLADRVPHTLEVTVDLIRPDTPFPPAFVTDSDDPLVATLEASGAGTARPFGAATEAGFFAVNGPTVVFGPGVLADDEGAVAHAEREYVHCSEVERAAEILQTALECRLDTPANAGTSI